MQLKQETEFCERSSEKQSEIHVAERELLANVSSNKEPGYSGSGNPERPSEDFAPDMPDTRPAKLCHKKSIRRAASSEMLVAHSANCKSSTSLSSSRMDYVTDDGEDDLRVLKGKDARSFSFNAYGDHSRDASNGLRNSVWRKVQQFRVKQSHSYEILVLIYTHEYDNLSYELFVKLYSCDEELSPFGLRNCGNCCYANTVLQCLTFTRPLTSYFVRRLHSNAWEGDSPLSPIRILSKIQKFGSYLGNGREEDAHEFLRYAVDTMQSMCLKEAGALGTLAEETTLVGLTFVGYLRSKITCMRCLGKSVRFERIMDLTVEIDGDIETLEEALTQFTADEVLDGENKYNCSRDRMNDSSSIGHYVCYIKTAHGGGERKGIGKVGRYGIMGMVGSGVPGTFGTAGVVGFGNGGNVGFGRVGCVGSGGRVVLGCAGTDGSGDNVTFGSGGTAGSGCAVAGGAAGVSKSPLELSGQHYFNISHMNETENSKTSTPKNYTSNFYLLLALCFFYFIKLQLPNDIACPEIRTEWFGIQILGYSTGTLARLNPIREDSNLSLIGNSGLAHVRMTWLGNVKRSQDIDLADGRLSRPKSRSYIFIMRGTPGIDNSSPKVALTATETL
ncbi:hypothetical protein GH714_034282 [Hevea brasiliensis]|uniref:USP domain-containing protein n=1 Tax=Hevea brasiliensis TaxID=3981 RepID=A0A6A6KZT0_HEVBR|nr:hypothetical protein GH714_034282 [Hevea brasiliensis]